MPPDILVLMTDQHRADWVGAYGNETVRTPTLDSLAAEGVVFTNCQTPSPLCMPARASFLTGQYPHNHGMWDNVGRIQDPHDSILHLLKQQGYRTCHTGKAHLHPHGGGRDLRDALPYMHALGWDDVRECTGPLSTQTTSSMLSDWMRQEGIYELFLEDYRRRRETGMNKALWPSPLPEGKHADDFIAGQAIDYIEGHDFPEPLFMFVGIGGPHSPWDPPASFDHFSADEMPARLPRDDAPPWLSGAALEHHHRMMGHNMDISDEEWMRVRALYTARVEHVDHLMGRILAAWQSRRGRDTWVVFWSDHGEMLGDKGRCSKSVFYRASVRVPLIMRPPHRTNDGRMCDGLTSLVDVTATLLESAGLTGTQPNVFGRSLMEAITGGETGRSTAISEVGRRTMVADGRWKMVLNGDGNIVKLFDTAEDPDERLNLAGKPGTEANQKRLQEALLSELLATADRQHREKNG